MICGVDEAGRGPVMGPMVVAAVMVQDDSALRAMGVKDSKLLSPAKRTELDKSIREICTVDLYVVSHDQIDVRGKTTLNKLEAMIFAFLLDRLRPSKSYLDACEVKPEKFRRMVERRASHKHEIICEHKADQIYPVVSAASIVAKVRRDELMREIEEEIGQPVGSGYSTDPATINFMERWINANHDLPPYTRRSWANAQKIMRLAKNSRITDWK